MDSNPIFTGASVICWLSLLITGWMSLGVPDSGLTDDKILVTWLMETISEDPEKGNSFDIHYVLFYMILILTLILATAAFGVYIYCLFINKNENVIGGMLGNFSKFHFVPLLCITILFIIGESLDDLDIFDEDGLFYLYFGIYFDIDKVHCAFNLIFDIIGLGSLVFITLNTRISEPNYANFIIKGTYSCFIALLVYNFFYVITLTGLINKLDDKKYDDIEDWLKSCGYAASILIGLINLGLSLFLKEIVLGIANLLMYIGMVTYFFKMEKEDCRKDVYGGDGIGVIEIIMLILSLATIAFLFIKYKPFNLKY